MNHNSRVIEELLDVRIQINQIRYSNISKAECRTGTNNKVRDNFVVYPVNAVAGTNVRATQTIESQICNQGTTAT